MPSLGRLVKRGGFALVTIPFMYEFHVGSGSPGGNARRLDREPSSRRD